MDGFGGVHHQAHQHALRLDGCEERPVAPGERRERGGGVGGRERPCSSASSMRSCSPDGGARYRNGRRRIRVPSAGGSCPTGDPCAFCARLVSRGPVYLSEKNSVDGGHAKWQIPCALRMRRRGRVRRPAARRTGTTMDRRLLPRRRTVPKGEKTWQNILPIMRENSRCRDSPTRTATPLENH